MIVCGKPDVAQLGVLVTVKEDVRRLWAEGRREVMGRLAVRRAERVPRERKPLQHVPKTTEASLSHHLPAHTHLDIPVDDPFGVEVCQGMSHLGRNSDTGRPREGLAASPL